MLADEHKQGSILPFPLEYQFLELPRFPLNQANQAPPRKDVVIKRIKYILSYFNLLNKQTKLDLPSALVLHPLLEDQGGLRFQLIQVLPVIVIVSI